MRQQRTPGPPKRSEGQDDFSMPYLKHLEEMCHVVPPVTIAQHVRERHVQQEGLVVVAPPPPLTHVSVRAVKYPQHEVNHERRSQFDGPLGYLPRRPVRVVWSPVPLHHPY